MTAPTSVSKLSAQETTVQDQGARAFSSPKEDAAPLVIPVQSRLSLELRMLLRHRMAMVGAVILLVIVAAALLAPWIAPYPYDAQNLDQIRVAPNSQFWMGTDSLGRDLFSRVLYGARIALWIGLLVVVIEVAVGVPLGITSGYFGGKYDVAVMTLVDIVWAFPPLVLALGVTAALGANLVNAVVAIAMVSWVPFARVNRAKVLSLRYQEYVQASKAIGGSHRHVLWRHILPNLLATNLVLITLTLPSALLTAAALSFLGFGVQPPTPEWGAMLNEGRPYLQEAPWIAAFPGLAILLTVIAFNLLGDGIRDVFDPKQKV